MLPRSSDCVPDSTKVRMLSSAASARDRKPCRAHYSADCEWGVMPWIAGLFCCSRSRTSIPLEEKKITCYWFVKGNKRRSYSAVFDMLCQTRSSVCKLRLLFLAAAAAQAQAEERRSLAGNSPGPATNAPAKPQGCKPGNRQHAPAQNLRCCTVTAVLSVMSWITGLAICFCYLTCGFLQV